MSSNESHYFTRPGFLASIIDRRKRGVNPVTTFVKLRNPGAITQILQEFYNGSLFQTTFVSGLGVIEGVTLNSLGLAVGESPIM